MPRRSQFKTPAQIGTIIDRRHGGTTFYRAQVTLTLVGGRKTAHGPLHRCRKLARKDLEYAQSASSYEEMGELLRALQEDAKEKAAKERTGDERAVSSCEAAVIVLGDDEEAIEQSSIARGISESILSLIHI